MDPMTKLRFLEASSIRGPLAVVGGQLRLGGAVPSTHAQRQVDAVIGECSALSASPLEGPSTFRVVAGPAGLAGVASRLADQPGTVSLAVDLERWRGRIVRFALGFSDGEVILVLPSAEVLIEACRLLRPHTVLVEDGMLLAAPEFENFLPERIVDVRVMESLARCGDPVSRWRAAECLASLSMAPLAPPLSSGLVGDIAYRARALHSALGPLTDTLAAQEQLAVFEVEQRLGPVLIDAARTGIAVDVTSLGARVGAFTTEVDEASEHLAHRYGRDRVQRPEQLLEAVRERYGLPIESWRLRELVRWDDEPDVRWLRRLLRARAELDNVLRPLERAVESDGRVHARMDQIGTSSGRMSCSQPNLMGFPRDPALRSLLVGTSLIDADYAAIDLRVAAQVFEDVALRGALSAGEDLHVATIARVLGIDPGDVTTEQRTLGKVVNFENLYGAGPDTLAQNAAEKYGVRISVERAADLIDAFRTAYPRLAHAFDMAAARRYPPPSRTLLGRLRSFRRGESPGAQLAALVQGTGADGLKIAMCELSPDLKKYGARLLLCVHDQLLVEAPTESSALVRVLVERHMREAMECFTPDVPIVVKAEIKATWGG